jgi:predicted ATPase
MPKRRTTRARSNDDPRITGLSVRGFKSISDRISIDVRRLTVLAGANSSGKSSIIQPLLLLKQTLDAPFDPGALRISGPNVVFTSAEQFLSKIAGIGQAGKFEIEVELMRDHRVGFTFARDPKEIVKIELMTYDSNNEKRRRRLRPGMTNEQIDREFADDKEFQSFRSIFRAKEEEQQPEVKLVRSRFFLQLELAAPRMSERFGLALSPAGALPRCVGNIIHVPGLRGNPERTYRTSAVGVEFPGLFNDYVASIVHSWKSKRDERLNRLGVYLKKLGLTWKVDTRQVDDTRVEVRVGRLPQGSRGGARDMVSIADVGFGVSQILPVVVSLLAAAKGQMVYIEQPEIHLHPRAQVELAGILADAVNQGVRVIVETHSSLLILSLQTLVAERVIDARDVILHWFTRRPDDGATQVKSTTLDQTGTYGDWPIDFGEIELELQHRYLDLVESVT